MKRQKPTKQLLDRYRVNFTTTDPKTGYQIRGSEMVSVGTTKNKHHVAERQVKQKFARIGQKINVISVIYQ